MIRCTLRRRLIMRIRGERSAASGAKRPAPSSTVSCKQLRLRLAGRVSRGDADRLDRLMPKWLTGIEFTPHMLPADRKSTRLNSSHVEISYAVFCLKKKKKKKNHTSTNNKNQISTINTNHQYSPQDRLKSNT